MTLDNTIKYWILNVVMKRDKKEMEQFTLGLEIKIREVALTTCLPTQGKFPPNPKIKGKEVE